MQYHYDLFGWYTSSQHQGRVTDLEPPLLTETETPGDLRPNWDGYGWRLTPYVAHAPLVPVIEQPPIPASVSPAQAREALLEAGLLDAVTMFLDTLPPEQAARAKLKWEYATSVERQSPLVALLQHSLQLTDGQVDALFTRAAEL